MNIVSCKSQPQAIKKRAFSSKSRIYVWPQGETLIENLENRRTRPKTYYRKEVLPKVFEMLNMPSDTKVRWSQYAGCKCPCSPGFIIESGDFSRDIFVTIEENS